MLHLTGDLTRGADGLRVAYRVRNAGREPAYVSAVPTDAAGAAHPGSAYAALSPDGLALRLVLGQSPVPTDRAVEVRAAALCVEVPPGRETAGEVRLTVPVKEWDAYAAPDHPADGWEPAEGYCVVLVVEAVWVSTARFADAAADHPGLWCVGGTRVRLEQTFVPDAPVPALRRPGRTRRR
jgi:hypothetical protein